MKRVVFGLIMLVSATAFGQTYLNFTPELEGEYKIDVRPVWCYIQRTTEIEEEQGEDKVHREHFLISYNKKSAQEREVRSSSDSHIEHLGEWYRVGRTFGRFILNNNGQVQYQQGIDEDYNKVIEVSRTYTFPGRVERSELSIYEGESNEELQQQKKAEISEKRNCQEAERELKDKYMGGQGTLRFEFEDKTLYIVKEGPDENADSEGIITVLDKNTGAPILTHKVKFTWKEKLNEYMSIVEKLECGVPDGVEQPKVEIDKYTKFVIIGGEKYTRARGW